MVDKTSHRVLKYLFAISGVATLYFVKNGGATGVVSQLLGDASNGKIYYTKGSPNKLLYTGNVSTSDLKKKCVFSCAPGLLVTRCKPHGAARVL